MDPEAGYFKLTFGGRSITCRESLSELTSAVAMSRCDDKQVTRRLLEREGLRCPAQRVAGTAEENAAFLAEHGSVVVKPSARRTGRGAVAVDLTAPDEVETAVEAARGIDSTVILEEFVKGQDLRIIVIGDEVVAAAIRKPAEIVGTGQHTVAQLIERQSRRRAAATGGESRIFRSMPRPSGALPPPATAWTTCRPRGRRSPCERPPTCIPAARSHDVTAQLHPVLADAAVRGARALEIPLVGFDFMVEAPDREAYAIIEANERPGLANHEPQPTAQKFIDLLFPQTVVRSRSPLVTTD